MEVDYPQLAMQLLGTLRGTERWRVRRRAVAPFGPGDQRPPDKTGSNGSRDTGAGNRDGPAGHHRQPRRQRVGVMTIGIG